jgi:hypothetical protein
MAARPEPLEASVTGFQVTSVHSIFVAVPSPRLALACQRPARKTTRPVPRVRGADPWRLAVSVRDGMVSISGRVEARSAVARLVSAVLAAEGVVGVDERAGFDLDDRYPPVPVTF